MKPITSVTGSIFATFAIVFALALGASLIPGTEEAASPGSAIAAESAADETDVDGIEVVIVGIRNDLGKVSIAVFNSANAFESYDYYRAIEYGEFSADTAQQGAVRVPFPRLRSGPYAIAVHHDENSDDEFNMDGEWPLEGYGTSGAKNAFHEPTFDEASIESGRVFIQMYYP